MIQEILRNATRGDKTPSQLLRYMRNQLGKHNVSADLVFAQFDHSVNAVRAPDIAKHERYEPGKTERALADLQRQIRELQISLRPRTRTSTPSRRRRTPSRERQSDQGVCWFHRTFGDGARNCAAISVVPLQNDHTARPTLVKLRAANGSAIDTYGERTLTLNIGMRRDFTWTFTVANVKVHILGADFLAHYALAVHMNPTTTNLRVLGTPTRQGSTGISVATCHGREYLDLLTQFTDITLPLQVTASGDHQTQHHIRTRGPPAHSHPRRLAPHKLAYAKKQFDKMLSDGIIRPSDSPYASPLHLVPKPGGEEFRICVDYRKLNASTVPDRYPVPHIHDFASGLMGARIFSKIDLKKKAYHQIPVAAEDVPKTAVTTPSCATRRIFRRLLQTFSKPTSPFVEELRHKMARLKYATPRQQPVNSYIPQHLRDCKFVLRRTDKHLTIKRANSTDTIAIDRTEPAFLEKRQYDANPALRPPNAIPAHPTDAAPQTSNDTPATPVRQTRSGRRVTFPKDLRKYYYY
ncbi:unnamed protein product [Acanthosepion pharaonis]|uniref:Reverse transcriptase domain-containing protein n=1 Tax=Acanthosepion pharaonis TaxID=158019 RepID=A0A812DIX4_ACAPH|nr:unnamed protein product [Sepia pharaonis]